MLNLIHTIVFDFDGVFTDNYVYTDSNGSEIVRTSRSDSYGLSNYFKFCELNNLSIDSFILSTETNEVVAKRASKLNLKAHLGTKDKRRFLEQYLLERNLGFPKGMIFLGNDLNDLECIKMAEFSFCPADAHKSIIQAVTHPCKAQGGQGFVREALEFLQSNTPTKGI